MNIELNFSSNLLEWDKTINLREMPWKYERDPYKIWISEIILQQTRVAQGKDYYERFIKEFPDVHSLAIAPENKVFKLWEGLGYYSRCKNLIASAKFIDTNLNGKFPETYESLLELKGIGPYTASAIASFAYNLPHAVLDGNVFRVLARYFGMDTPINSQQGKKMYAAKAKDLLANNNPATYNQAIMDFGAIICKPASPLCSQCPLQNGCVAYQTNLVSKLPVNEKRIIKRKRYFHFLVVEYEGKIYVRKRSEKDIWQNLYEFLLIESTSILNERELLANEKFKNWFKGNQFEIIHKSDLLKQTLTHQIINGRFFCIHTLQPIKTVPDYELVKPEQLSSLPFPKFITSFLKDKNVSLNLF